ncbi:unnamed protein product [Musa hybrid cultivar]
MAGSAAGAGGSSVGRTSVRVVVMGEAGTGKSSLIVAVATESFPENVPHVIPPTRLPADYYPDRVPLTIIDTSSRPENKAKLIAECKSADAIVLTYACDRPSTLDRLSTYWLPELRRLEAKVPVIVVGCKLDLRDEQQVSLEQVMSPIMQQYREIETCIECSALRQIQVVEQPFASSHVTLTGTCCRSRHPVSNCLWTCSCSFNPLKTLVQEVFYYAQKAVLHPTAPLFDQETQSLKPHCVRALKRIFILCDHDRDGALSDSELNDFQVRCFNAPLQQTEIAGVKKVVQEKLPEGVNDFGLTLTGFLFLHALFIEKGRLETTWTVLRKFGYDNDIKLRDDLLPTIFKRASDQTVELTNEAVDFLKGVFLTFDIDKFIGNKELVRHGVTRFATSFLTLQSVHRQKHILRNMFTSEKWVTGKWAKEAKDKRAADIILMPFFWNHVVYILKVMSSLVRVLRPWSEAPYKDAAEKNVLGGLSLEGFLSEVFFCLYVFMARYAISNNTARTRRYVSVRQLIATQTVHYRMVYMYIYIYTEDSSCKICSIVPISCMFCAQILSNVSVLKKLSKRNSSFINFLLCTIDRNNIILLQWALMTLQDPAASLANLIYIGYTGDPASAFQITRKRRLDRKKQQTQRNVFQCFVFGSRNAGKTTLLNSFIGRTFSEKYNPTTSDRFAANVVGLHNGDKKILVMREIAEIKVKNLLSSKESLAACDIAVFVHDSSDEESWKRTKELLVQVASHGENTGFEVPCLIISAKDDLDPYPLAVQDSTRVSQDMGIETPIPISMKLRDHNDVFRRIVSAAQQPHLSIPETEAGKSRKQYQRLLNRSLAFVSAIYSALRECQLTRLGEAIGYIPILLQLAAELCDWVLTEFMQRERTHRGEVV